MREVHEAFSSLGQWMSWVTHQNGVLSGEKGRIIGQNILQNGFIEPVSGLKISPDAVSFTSSNWREGLIANGLSSRVRAILHLIEKNTSSMPRERAKILAAEGVTPFAMIMRGHFPRFIGSEFSPGEAGERDLFPIPHQDFTTLTFPSDVFDIVTTNEVLEHIPDIDMALSEIARVLTPGGWHIGSVPFLFMQEVGDVRAKMVDGHVVHLKEPEWHGNPIDPEGGALVFETPAWNILERARAAGFSRAEMHFVASETHGYMTDHLGIFVLCAQK